jgi:uncharacterized protein (TIGR02246 family)
MSKRWVLFPALAVVPLAITLALAGQSGSGDNAQETQAIRKAVGTFAEAFNKGDVETFAGLWAVDADYVTETGQAFKGRDAIAGLLKKQLGENKGQKIKLRVTSLRFLKPDVAVEDGVMELTGADGTTTAGRYMTVWVKTDGRWQISSARDLPTETDAAESNAERLKGLEWLIGDWSHQDKALAVNVNCRWAMNKNFLQIEYTVKAGEGDQMHVVQWVGWDPIAGQMRSWVFDSAGGFGDAYWTRDGNSWIAEATGIVPDGRIGTANNVIKYVSDEKFVWQSFNREVDGQPLPDTEITFARKAAAP